jgi:hypothetical protein
MRPVSPKNALGHTGLPTSVAGELTYAWDSSFAIAGPVDAAFTRIEGTWGARAGGRFFVADG